MFRRLSAAIPPNAARWAACVLVLLVPGSFIALPIAWLVSRYAGRASA